METPSWWIPYPEKPVPRQSKIASRVPLSQRRKSPDDPIHTTYQERMLDALESQWAGHFRLTQVIYDIAKEEASKPNAHVSWSWLVDDQKTKAHNVYVQLLSLPKILLRSLIRNTLPYDCAHDKDVKAAADKYMGVTNLPGIYCQAIATKHSLFGDVKPEDVGKGWSRDQVEKLCADIDLYLEDGAQGDEWGLRVDKHIPTGIDEHEAAADDLKNRRYCINSQRDEQRKTLIEWRNLLQSQQSFDSTSRLDGAEHSVRARMEVGWSIDQAVGLSHHTNNKQTTHVWGLAQALSRLNWPREYSTPYQWSLFRVWGADQRLARLSEHLGSVLCSAYTWEGGFNCTEAGAISFEDDAKAALTAPGWDENGTEVFITRIRTTKRLDKDLEELRTLREKVRATPTPAELKEKEKEAEKSQAEAAASLKQYYEIVANTERMRVELAKLNKQIAEAKPKDPAIVARDAALARAREHLAKLQKANAAKRGAAKEGAAKEGAAKEGATKEGAAKEGAAKEAAAKEAAARESTELASSRVPETPLDRQVGLAGVSPVTSTQPPQVEESSAVDDDLTDVTTDPPFPSSSIFAPRSS